MRLVHSNSAGLVLTELLVAGLVAAFLMLGLVQMAAATSRSLTLIESLSESQQGGRFAVEQVRDAIMAAGFHPEPWNSDTLELGITADTADGGAGESDLLVLRRHSDRNCFDRLNPALDGEGRPAFYLRESRFERSGSGNLAHTCYYGPDESALVRQINRSGLVQNVESFQALYLEDSDGDQRVDRRVRAGNWVASENVMGVQLGLLLATAEAVGQNDTTPLNVLDEAVTPPLDGRLRRVWTTTVPLGFKLR